MPRDNVFRLPVLPLLLLVVAFGSGCSSSRGTAGPDPDEPVIKQSNRTRMYYRGIELEAELDYYWANRHLGDQWLILKLSMAGIGPVTRVDGNAIRVRTPEGYRIPLPDQQEFLEIYPDLRVTLDAAKAWVGPTGKFAGAMDPCGYWFIVPRGTTSFARYLDVTPLRVCYGPLVFQVPLGVQPGRWVLEIDLQESDVRIPFVLGERRRR
jgi:hypothetical protein